MKPSSSNALKYKKYYMSTFWFVLIFTAIHALGFSLIPSDLLMGAMGILLPDWVGSILLKDSLDYYYNPAVESFIFYVFCFAFSSVVFFMIIFMEARNILNGRIRKSYRYIIIIGMAYSLASILITPISEYSLWYWSEKFRTLTFWIFGSLASIWWWGTAVIAHGGLIDPDYFNSLYEGDAK